MKKNKTRKTEQRERKIEINNKIKANENVVLIK